MTKLIGQNINTSSSSQTTEVIVDSTTAVTLLPVRTEPVLSIHVTNLGNRDLVIRDYAASIDNNKNGIIVEGGETRRLVDFTDNYLGEISGIMVGGPARKVVITVR